VIEQAGWEEFLSKDKGETFDGIGIFGRIGTVYKLFERGFHWHVFSLVGIIGTVTTGLVFNTYSSNVNQFGGNLNDCTCVADDICPDISINGSLLSDQGSFWNI
jgi:hypothetical protein